jgi:hypothetical protein
MKIAVMHAYTGVGTTHAVWPLASASPHGHYAGGGRGHRHAGPHGDARTGPVADLILVQGNPLDDIRLLQHAEPIPCVIKAGQIVQGTVPLLSDNPEPGRHHYADAH